MKAHKKRILTMVPNGATSDNRVVREAESLKKAGYDVLLTGLKLSNLPGSSAFTQGNVPVKRIDWRYAAYSRVVLTYLFLFVPIVALISLFISLIAYQIYTSALVPAAVNIFDIIYVGELGLTKSPAKQLLLNQPIWFHLLSILLYIVSVTIIVRIFKRSNFARVYLGSLGRVVEPFFRTVRVAQRYGESENMQITWLERLFDKDNTFFRGIHDLVAQRHITHARTKGFVDIGLEFSPDIIHCHEIGCLSAAIKLKNRLNCKVIYEAHEIYDDLANASITMSKQHQRIHKNNIEHIDGFITVNEHIGQYYTNTYNNIPEPIIVPNSVYPTNKLEYDGRLHEAAKLPNNAKIILYQGGFSPNRGLNILLDAAYELPEDWFVVFMGKGPEEEGLRAKSEELLNEKLRKIRKLKQLEALSNHNHTDEKLYITTEQNENEDNQTLNITAESFLLAESIKNVDKAGIDNIFANIEDFRRRESIMAANKKLTSDFAKITLTGLYEKARFIPLAPHSELINWTSGATVGVIPYENVGLNHWYCSPNKIWEYPNAKVPILASRLSYLNYIIEKWNIGWTISSDPTAQEIVSKIQQIENEELNKKIEACEKFIENDNYLFHEKRLLSLFKAM